MRLKVWRALAWGTLLESLRRKDLWVVAILGFLIMLFAGALGVFGIDGLEIFAKDLGVTVLGGLSSVIAVLTASRALPDEIRQRTLYPLLARPISRFDLLAGKLLGCTLVTWIAFAMLAALTSLALLSFRIPLEPVMLQYLLVKAMGLSVVCAVSLALSVYMTPSAAATLSFTLLFGSGMLVRALLMSYENASSGAGLLYKAIYALLPQYGLFDLGSRVVNRGWGPVPFWVVGSLAAYAALYGLAMLALSWHKFHRQAV